VVVEVDDGLEEVVRRLQISGLEVTVDANRITVLVQDRVPVGVIHDRVRDAVADAGAGIRRLSDRTTSLEDVFLEVGA
jgi:hypothetical protein